MQMLANFVGGGAAINVLAASSGASLLVVDVGVAGSILPARLSRVSGRLRPGSRSRGNGRYHRGPAMTRAEAIAAIGVGLAVVDELVASGLDLIGVGEMGPATPPPPRPSPWS